MTTFPTRSIRILALGSLFMVGLRFASPAQGPTFSVHDIFDQPFVFQQLSEVMVQGLQYGQAGQVEQMEAIMTALVERIPDHPVPFYNLACANARLGKTDRALDALEQAVSLGLVAVERVAGDPDLASLRDHARFADIVEKAKTVEPFSMVLPLPTPLAPIDGVAWVRESNTGWDARRALLASLFTFEDPPPPVQDVVTGSGAARDLVRRWYGEGSAAGNHHDLYDNRDGDHSNLKYDRFPQLTRVEYSPEATQRKLHWGPQTMLLYNRVTIGNASVAATSDQQWGSMARHLYVSPRVMAVLYAQYRTNHLYVYPEHKDHDIGHNGTGGGHGDVFCLNTPYVVISQGSSGSDKKFLDAFALTLAAFRPEVKPLLAKQGLLMPTLQMILRRCGKQVNSASDYLSGVAHPTVFDGKMLNPERMVKLAHAVTPDALPPLVQLKVVEEDTARPGIDFFHTPPSEVIATTPGSIGRVVRSTRFARRMVVSAADSLDANGLPLTYHWRVLRGDSDRIQINPLDEARSRVELIIPYHGRFPVTERAKLESNRVDIGVFVHNGAHYSAPAFVSFFYLDNELRIYDESDRIQSVQYSGGTTPGNYVDPRIDAPKDWRDDYRYDKSGALTGWTRTMAEGQTFEFTPEGAIVLERDGDGIPTETRVAVYPKVVDQNGRAILAQATVEPKQPPGPRIQ